MIKTIDGMDIDMSKVIAVSATREIMGAQYYNIMTESNSFRLLENNVKRADVVDWWKEGTSIQTLSNEVVVFSDPATEIATRVGISHQTALVILNKYKGNVELAISETQSTINKTFKS